MKVRTSEVKKKFEPFEITLTIETLEEARALFFIFNNGPIIDYACPELAGICFESPFRRYLVGHCPEADCAGDFVLRFKAMQRGCQER